jgi:signal transduction histidine kinase
MPETSPGRFWNYARGLGPPMVLWALFVGYIFFLQSSLFEEEETAEGAALEEWVQESRLVTKTLPELVRDYQDWARRTEDSINPDSAEVGQWVVAIQTFLRSLGEPTKQYQGQLPFFPMIYRIELEFLKPPHSKLRYMAWDSGIPRDPNQSRIRPIPILNDVLARVQYQFHTYNKHRQDEQARALRARWVTGLAAAATALAFFWIYMIHRREQERDRQRALAQRQIDQAERLLLMEELRRQEAEHRQEESERDLLEQRLATQESERQLLELKSQLFANIGIMAGSYAHNIKNLLVRPNDLLSRCLEADGMSRDQEQMLAEVRQTLGTVTERLQQILQTVHRDPSRAELTRIDLNELAAEMQRNWEDLAQEKWKLTLTLELCEGPMEIEGDLSHLQQAAENLLFNARDATFEMRNHLREKARRGSGPRTANGGGEDRRQALIAAAAWKGRVCLRTRRQEGRAVLEVQDNGIGMTEEVRRRCTETHFSTKRNNALYEGYNSGMGLGLSFVVVILKHHGASLQIDSEPFQGTTFRVSFPLPAAEKPGGMRP